MTKLNQIIAIEKGVKSRVYKRITEAYKRLQKGDLFGGLARRYKPLDDDGEVYPPEDKRVQYRVQDLLGDIREAMSEYFDVAAARDFANCGAAADVVVDGTVVLRNVPPTFLLFLEKQLGDLKAEIDMLPELDPNTEWVHDPQTSLFRGSKVQTAKTKKISKPVTLYDATKEHPAQVQLVSEDVLVGHWTTEPLSGALKTADKRELQRRINELIKAVKFAREAANSVEVPSDLAIGKPIFDYLLSTAG